MAVALSLGLMGAAFALFSDTASSDVNSFSAGTLEIDIDTSATWTAGVDNMKPGETATLSGTITNIGSLPLDFEITGTVLTGAIILGGANDPFVAEVRINGDNTTLLGSLAVGATDVIAIDVTLPVDAGDAYQAKAGNLAVTVDATSQ